MTGDIPAFGDILADRDYIDRPGSYGIVLGPTDDILIVEIGDVRALPGGGLEDGESAKAGLLREVREETGYHIRDPVFIGTARQYMKAPKEDAYYHKICSFFLVQPTGHTETASEEDHRVAWIPIEEALTSLTEGAQRWAVAKAIDTLDGP